MFSKTISKLSCAVLALTLVGCSSLSQATPTTSPTPTSTVDSQATLDALSNSVVQTVYVALTQSAPTITPTPTATETLLPTATETVGPTITPTHAFIAWTQTPTPTQAAYSCSLISVSPASSTKINANTAFDAVWTVKNTGYNTWNDGNTDIRYIDGQAMQTGGNAVDLNSSVAPNGTATITVDMQAPDGDGTYTTTWGIYLEDGTICSLSLTINSTK